MSERPLLTITEAANAAGVDRRTIRRRLDSGAFPGAVRDQEHGPHRGAGGAVWRIPIEDLLAAGLVLHAPTAAEEPTPPAPVVVSDAELLRQELEVWRRRAEVAEAVAEERGHALDDARLALRALTAGDSEGARGTGTVALTPPEDETVPPTRARAGLFGRWRRNT